MIVPGARKSGHVKMAVKRRKANAGKIARRV
jgi:hypothetical protein